MPWLVGIDEAGYGPNLGPFVMASAACHIPGDPNTTDLWNQLRSVARRKKDTADGRLWIEDSKVVYTRAKGLKELERSVHAGMNLGADSNTLAGCVQHLANAAADYLAEECWYTGSTPLPCVADADEIEHTRLRWQKACQQADVVWGQPCCAIVCPARFNGLLDRWGSKSIVLLVAFAELLQRNYNTCSDDSVHVFVDKHGGRNNYVAILEEALPDGAITAVEEGVARSRYRVDGLAQEMHVTFQPRADLDHFCVAFASMMAKYLRELLMHEFNQFWRQHVPDIKPTAGYPVDAARFFAEIREMVDEMGIVPDALWRRK